MGDGYCTGQSKITLAADQAATRRVYGDQCGRARRLDGDGRPPEAEMIRDACCQIVFFVSRDHLEGAHVVSCLRLAYAPPPERALSLTGIDPIRSRQRAGS